MKLTNYILAIFLFLSIGGVAQEKTIQQASYSGSIELLRVVPSLSSRDKLEPADPMTEAPKDGRSSRNLVIPGKDKQTETDFLVKTASPLSGKIQSKAPSLVFEVNNNNVGSPSDPDIGVGPDHAVIVYNTGFIIYDKEGNDLTGPLNVNNIFSNGGCCDLTISYDNDADRWVMTYLFFTTGAEVAVSDGSNPVTSNWYVYSLPQISDYQKLSIWSDGYYMSQNVGGANKIWVLERDEMLNGNTSAGIQSFDLPGLVTSGFISPQVLNVSDDNMPAAGGATVIYEQDDAWGGVAEDHIKFWTIDVDWDDSSNSTVSAPTEFVTTPFIGVFDGGGFSNLVQPGGGAGIDALQAIIMNQAQFRKFSDHNSAVFNFVVDVDATGEKLAGIRWYEFRQSADGEPWEMYQEGTYTSPDGKHAWMGSMMMDGQGNIGMGYSAMAGPDTPDPTSHRVSAFYTGRYANDPLGTMTISEELISQGTQDVAGTRFGDYAKLDIDPNNDNEFWFATEYANTDVVGVFQIAGDFNNDIGAITVDSPQNGALTANEEVTVTIFNYGLVDASGFNVTYQIDAGTVVTEPFVGTITPGTSAQFTFSTLGDFSTEGQTYTITTSTEFASDEFNDNNAFTQEVTHLFANDVGVSSISSPTSGSGLGATENVTIVISNFGTATQTSIPVFFTLDGGTPIEETYTGALGSGETDEFTFSATVNLENLDEYNIVAGTNLTGDGNQDNDDVTAVIINLMCQPESNCFGFNDGVSEFELADQNLTVECSSSGYTNNTDVVFNFVLDNNPFSGNLQMGYAGNYSLWIDFNDDYTFDASEKVSSGTVPTANTDFSFSLDFSDFSNVETGMHLMRLRGGDPGFGENIEDPCEDLTYGRTNDFTANITGTLVGVESMEFESSEILINSLSDDKFELIFNTSNYTDKLPVTIYSTTGQILAYYTLENKGSGYSKIIDMSFVSSGVYFVKVGEESLNIVKRIIVK